MSSFISPDDLALEERFLRDGYVIERAESIDALVNLRECVLQATYEHLGIERTAEDWPLDDQSHFSISSEKLNPLKLHVMAALNSRDWTRKAYYSLAKGLLHALIGNELAMQKRFNLNIQLPGDNANLLPIHADTWTGDSPFQCVLWVPLVDCYGSKSMWILPPEHMDAFMADFPHYRDAEGLYQSIAPSVKRLEVKFGEVLLFNSTLPHGNRTNEERGARWSLNCRFKSVFTPYGVKNLGEHFEPITLRAASRIGLTYKYPVCA